MIIQNRHVTLTTRQRSCNTNDMDADTRYVEAIVRSSAYEIADVVLDLSPREAREIATALNAAADVVDEQDKP